MILAVWFISFVLLVITTVHQTVISMEHLATGYRRLFFVFLGRKTLLTDFQHTKFYRFLNLSFRFILNFLKMSQITSLHFFMKYILHKRKSVQ